MNTTPIGTNFIPTTDLFTGPEFQILDREQAQPRVMPRRKVAGRSDGLPKDGISWTSYKTRVKPYRLARKVKLRRERAARRCSA